MAIYFIGDYPVLLESLKSKALMDEQISTLKTSMEEVQSQMDGITVLLEELQGSYSGELAETFNALINEVMITYKNISDGLNGTVTTLGDLACNLGEFKTNDDSLESNTNSLTREENRSVTHYETNEDNESVETDDWINWNKKVNELRSVVEDIKKAVFEYKGKSDDDITAIKEFNEGIIDIRLKLATVAFAQDGLTLEEIKKLTPLEREQLIQKMIDAMTEKYNHYKEVYEEYASGLCDLVHGWYPIVLADIYNVINTNSSRINFDGKTDIQLALQFVNLIIACENLKTEDGRNLIECIREYGETGDFIGSGLGELYWANGDFHGLSSQTVENGYYNGDMERWFEEELDLVGIYMPYTDIGWKKSEISISDICTDIAENYDNVREYTMTFKENYDNALNVGVAIKGMQELKGHVKYDTVYMNPDYIEYNSQAGPLASFLEEMCNGDLSADKTALLKKATYMTQSELEMFRYLYDTEGYSSAKAFEDSIDISLTKREGVVKASEYYNYLMDGSNAGVEAVWDHISTGGTGFGDGFVDFCDGIRDLVAPDKKLSVDEYAQVAFVEMLTDGGTSYDKSLLASYNVGSAVGKESIPIALGLIHPSLGKGVKIASTMGNNLETYFRADENTTYLEAAAHAGLDMLTTDGIATLASVVGLDSTPAGKLGVAAIKNMVNAGVKYAYDPDGSTSIISSLTKFMKGEISGDLASRGTDMLSDYLQGVGWPEGWADATAGLFKPAMKTTASAALNAGEEMFNVAGNNVINGKNDDILTAGVSKFEESFDYGDMATGYAKKAANDIKGE